MTNAWPADAWPSSHTPQRSFLSPPISGWSVPLSTPCPLSLAPSLSCDYRASSVCFPASLPSSKRCLTTSNPFSPFHPHTSARVVYRYLQSTSSHFPRVDPQGHLLRQSAGIIHRTLPCHATEARVPRRYPDRLVSTPPTWRLCLTHRHKPRSRPSTRPRAREGGRGSDSLRRGSRSKETVW